MPNRTSVQVGAGTPATTTYDAADRPTSGANPTASYSNDADGRLTARPGQQLTWDHLGRITGVKDGSGTLLASYTYDPLDRLRLIDYGAGTRIRFRYVGLTTTVAQWLDDASGTVTRSVGTGWAGERLLDWTGSGSNIRVYGEDGHKDVTWLASNTGTVSASLRYDPWGTPRASVPSGYSPFRFQGAYTDDLRDADNTNDLAWVITRWYAPTLGRFVSEDSLTGEPIDPPSRNLYAYGQGDPVGTWDPDGRHWYVVASGDTFDGLSRRFYGTPQLTARITQGNPGGLITPVNLSVAKSSLAGKVGKCIWIPFTQRRNMCQLERRNSTQSGQQLWATFDGIVKYITREMSNNARPFAGGVGLYLGNATLATSLASNQVLWAFHEQVKGGGPWDHKPTLRRVFGHGLRFWTPVRDDPAPERIFYDIWSNIHYGYVGRAHGIPASLLIEAQRKVGVSDAADDLSVRIGIDLWQRHYSITQTILRTAVLHALPRYRRTGVENVVIPPLRALF